MTTIPPDEHALHAYVDGRLTPEQHAAVAAWLQAHPAQAARVAAWKRDAEALRAAHAGLMAETGAVAFTPAAIRRG
ncbi:membrane protein, partial [Xanthomonas euvesicatoria]